MLRKILALCVLPFIGCAPNQTAAEGTHETDLESLKIAAWNIEHLAASPGLGCEPRDEAGYQLVSQIIEDVDADVWLLQEIENEAALARVFGTEGWVFHVEERPDTGSSPACWGRDDGATLRMQRTAIAIRADIEHSRSEDLAALDVGGRGFLRHGVTVTALHNGEPIDFLSIHLKSGCFSGDGSDDCPRLFAQIPVLEEWIDERGESDRAVVIGGDFNRRLERPDDSVWADLNDGTPLGLSIAGEGVGPQCDPRYSEFIDFIIANERAARRFEVGSFAETTFEEGRRASDHCPVTIVLN